MMRKMHLPSMAALLIVLCGLSITAAPAFAQSASPDPGAVEKLRASMSFLADMKTFGIDTQTTLEAVLESGQKIQFADAVQVTVKRPNKMLAVRSGELVEQEFYYNGASLTLSNPGDGFYATVDAPDTLEGMLDFAREQLDIVAPAGDFLYANAFDILMEGVTSAFVVGPSYFEGVLCDHLAFSAPGTDFQVWVQQGDKPLPRMLVITSRDVLNAPQFTVEISDWNLSPAAGDDLFNFSPPEGAVAIEFMAVGASE